MTNDQIRATRIAHQLAPRLWAFAFPVYGRGFVPVRLMALRLWVLLLRWELRRVL